MKKSKIPKLCKNIGLGKLFLEKITFSSIGFLSYSFGNRVGSLHFAAAQDHILLKNRLKIKEVKTLPLKILIERAQLNQ